MKINNVNLQGKIYNFKAAEAGATFALMISKAKKVGNDWKYENAFINCAISATNMKGCGLNPENVEKGSTVVVNGYVDFSTPKNAKYPVISLGVNTILFVNIGNTAATKQTMNVQNRQQQKIITTQQMAVANDDLPF